MNRFFSLRPFALLLATVGFLALANTARAVERSFASHGTAEFITADEFVGAGKASHLGLYSEDGSAEFSPTDNPSVLRVDAWSTYTAANGDQLFAAFVGELNVSTGVITATVTYEGGTGRFANASGTARLSGQQFSDGTIEVAVHGTINY